MNWRFNLYDIIGYLIPGAITLAILAHHWPRGRLALPGGEATAVILFVAASYALGHVLHAVGRGVMPSPDLTTPMLLGKAPNQPPWWHYWIIRHPPALSGALQGRVLARLQDVFGLKIAAGDTDTLRQAHSLIRAQIVAQGKHEMGLILHSIQGSLRTMVIVLFIASAELAHATLAHAHAEGVIKTLAVANAACLGVAAVGGFTGIVARHELWRRAEPGQSVAASQVVFAASWALGVVLSFVAALVCAWHPTLSIADKFLFGGVLGLAALTCANYSRWHAERHAQVTLQSVFLLEPTDPQGSTPHPAGQTPASVLASHGAWRRIVESKAGPFDARVVNHGPDAARVRSDSGKAMDLAAGESLLLHAERIDVQAKSASTSCHVTASPA